MTPIWVYGHNFSEFPPNDLLFGAIVLYGNCTHVTYATYGHKGWYPYELGGGLGETFEAWLFPTLRRPVTKNGRFRVHFDNVSDALFVRKLSKGR